MLLTSQGFSLYVSMKHKTQVSIHSLQFLMLSTLIRKIVHIGSCKNCLWKVSQGDIHFIVLWTVIRLLLMNQKYIRKVFKKYWQTLKCGQQLKRFWWNDN